MAFGEGIELIQATRMVNAGGSKISKLTQMILLPLWVADNNRNRKGTSHAEGRRSYTDGRVVCYTPMSDGLEEPSRLKL